MYIVATISKNSYSAEKIEEILRAGATVLRYNFSHGSPAEMKEKIDVARGVIKSLGMEGKIIIFADLPGDKVRLGNFPSGDFPVEKGKLITFKSASHSEDPAQFIPVDYPKIGTLVEVGQIVSCGDGEIGFEVTKIADEDTFTGKALNPWHIPALKALNIGRGIDDLDHLTMKTVAHIEHLKEIKPEWVAFSFVNNAEYLKKGKALLEKNGIRDVKIVSKIESQRGLDNLDEIIDESDIILVARGDMGLLTPIELLGINQKKIVYKTKAKNKQVIVSTQILDSLLSYMVPSRAEVLNLTNIILDGTDGIMLAKETGISLTPGYSVAVAKRIIEAVEKSTERA
jgi:pyruvate kinase